jgi:hypothetical protein
MVAAIYIFILLAFGIFALGLWIKDYTLILFSSFLIILSGLSVFINGFEELAVIYTKWLGIIIMSIGSYIAVKASIDMING